MEEGEKDGFRSGLRVAQRCRSAQTGDVANLTRAGEGGDQAVLLGSSCRSRSHAGYLWPPTARSTAGEDFSLAGSVRKRGSAGFLVLAALCQNSLPSAGVPRGARPLPASRRFGSVSSFWPLRTSQPGASPRTCWFKPTWAGGAAALPVLVVFRQRHCRLSSVVNWFRLGAFFHLARPTLTLLAGDFVSGFQDCPERAGP
jgi:hypothetical protein